MISCSNASKLLFSQVQNNALNIKPKASQGAADTAFKSVFESAVNSNKRNDNDRPVFKKENDISQNSESKVKYKSFKEVERDKSVNENQSLVEKTNGDVTAQKVDSETEKSKSSSKDYDEAINVLAQMLGIQPNELVKIANELGFSAEDLKNADKLSSFIGELANQLELNDSQKAMMNTLAVEIPKQVSKETSKEAIKEDASSLEVNETEGNENEATVNINRIKTVDLSEISDDIKAKLDQLIQNAEISSESVGTEISKVVEAMRAQAKANVNVSTEQDDIKTDTTIESKPITEGVSEEGAVNKSKEESAKASDSKYQENTDKAKATDTKAEVATSEINAQVTSSNDQNQPLDQQNTQVVGDIKVNMVNNQTQVPKSEISMPQPVRTTEVINQVVEQAKVVIGQDKSEMIIHLKPDHLGKLELKVVTEQGIVAAKFIAESNQVKEIIETNMQLLKDSLEKQGLSIDNVSVQVGQEKQKEFREQSSYQSRNKDSNDGIKYGSNELNTVKVGYNALDTLPERLAQYVDDTNTVNFTA